MLAKGPSLIIICFDSKVVEESWANSESSLSQFIFFDHTSNKVLEALIYSVWLAEGYMIYAKIPVLLLLGKSLEHDHLFIVNLGIVRALLAVLLAEPQWFTAVVIYE